MPLPIASHNDVLLYRGHNIPLKGLSSVNIDFERRVITYTINVDTVLQGTFMEYQSVKNAVVYDKEVINKPCILQIKGIGDCSSTFLSYVYNTRKNKYQCTIIQSFSNDEKVENIIDIADNKFNTLDFS